MTPQEELAFNSSTHSPMFLELKGLLIPTEYEFPTGKETLVYNPVDENDEYQITRWMQDTEVEYLSVKRMGCKLKPLRIFAMTKGGLKQVRSARERIDAEKASGITMAEEMIKAKQMLDNVKSAFKVGRYL